MTPFQQMLLGTVPSGSKVYVDTVFDTVARVSDGSTYVNSSGLNLSLKCFSIVISKVICIRESQSSISIAEVFDFRTISLSSKQSLNISWSSEPEALII